jgi:hypothetical protein
VLIGVIALFSAGCSDDGPKGWPDGWTVPEGGLLDITYPDLGLVPDGLPYSPDGPKIEILTPKNGETILGDVLTVEAKITDPTTVNPGKVELFYKAVTVDGKAVNKQQLMTAKAGVADVYESKLDVSSYVKFNLWITAEDMDQNKNTSKAVYVERDAGPSIIFLLPVEKSSHKGSVAVQIQVSDKNGVTKFQLLIGTTDITSKLKNTSSDAKLQQWSGSIKFDDPDFSPPLSGTQVLTARAENKNKATAQETRTFVVDDQGPSISILSQSAGELVGGLIDVKASVSDPAGVLASSVKVVIGNNQDTRTVVLKPPASGAVFEAQFDTRTLTQSDLWPVMSFRAADKLGNESHQDIQVGLDNGQPILSLDPPEDYHIAKKDKGVVQCSQPFDPVGPLAASDKQKVPQVQFLRARIEDQGNGSTVPSAPWVPVATVDPGSVYLYVLDDTQKALLVDSDGDGYCDDINPNVIPKGTAPQKGEAVAVNMQSIQPGGAADFQATTETPPAGCDSWGTADEPPDELCLPVLATYMTYYTNQSEPSIYTIPPVSGAGFECLGLPFDFGANLINDGWACVATVAKDKLGNRGVSTPLRLWVDKKWLTKTTGYTPAPSNAGAAPSCTGTLKKDGTVDMSKPCMFKDRRKAANCGRKCPSCASGASCPLMTFPQTFCHCEVWLQK